VSIYAIFWDTDMEHFTVQANSLKNSSARQDSSAAQSSSMSMDDLEPEFLTSLPTAEMAAIQGGVPVQVTSERSLRSASTAVINQPFISPAIAPAPSDWSESLQSFLDQPPSSLPRRLAASTLAFCCVFGVWAWFGQVQQVSHAQGRLIPQGEIYKVQPAIPGEVTQIRVEEGQSVRAGQVIAELDDRLAQTEIDRLEHSLNALRQQLLQIHELMDRASLRVETQRAVTAAETQAQAATIAEAQAKANLNRTILPQLQAKVAAYQARMARLQPLVEVGAIAQDRLFEAEQALLDQQQVITQNQGELQQMLSEADRLQAEMAEKRAAARKSEIEMQQQMQQLRVEATQIQAKIAETEALLKASETRLNQLFLYAPVNGMVSTLNIHRIGEVTQAGQTFAEIIPNNTPLVMSAMLPDQEAGLVQQGMKVQLKFDAFPYQDYGILSGRVLSVSPDAKVDEHQGSVYQVEIALDKTYVTHNQQRISFKPGQTASAEIVTSRQRIVDVLLDPIRKLQESNLSL
jgi:hemolysin D